MFNSKKRSPFRAALAAAAAVALLGMGATSAVAATEAPDTPGAHTVDGTKKGSLTIHKFVKPDAVTNIPNNGTEQNVEGLTGMNGVEFTVEQVDSIDLTTNEGWAKAADLTVEKAKGQLVDNGGQPKTGVTKDGVAKVEGLPVGLYLVTETKYPAGATPAAPFLVTIPLTDPDSRNSWMYDVHVYPKNSVDTAKKTVNDASAVKLGDKVEFQIKGSIPNEKVIDGYKMTDKLDEKLTYESTSVTLENGVEIKLEEHYKVSFDEASNTLTVEFTEPGRVILAENHTSEVVFDIVTTVNTIGEIANHALLYPNKASFDKKPGNPPTDPNDPNNPGDPGDPGTPGEPGGPIVTPEVVTKWGKLTIEKVDSKDNAKKLEDAEFAVFLTEEDARKGTNAIDFGNDADGNPIKWVTNAQGLVTIEGLRYSGWVNGAKVDKGEDGFRSYWLAEIKAPADYELLAAPIEFEIDNADQKIDLEVKNVKDNGGFELPLTGGAGTALFTIVGGLLVAGAVVLTVRSRRKANA